MMTDTFEKHLSDEEAGAWVAGLLLADESARMQTHALHCEACASKLTAESQLQHVLESHHQFLSRPETARRFAWPLGALAVAAAAVLLWLQMARPAVDPPSVSLVQRWCGELPQEGCLEVAGRHGVWVPGTSPPNYARRIPERADALVAAQEFPVVDFTPVP